MWYLNPENPIVSVLKDESGANAVEYALIMALIAIFMVVAVILMATELGNLFNSMAKCAADVVNCAPSVF